MVLGRSRARWQVRCHPRLPNSTKWYFSSCDRVPSDSCDLVFQNLLEGTADDVSFGALGVHEDRIGPTQPCGHLTVGGSTHCCSFVAAEGRGIFVPRNLGPRESSGHPWIESWVASPRCFRNGNELPRWQIIRVCYGLLISQPSEVAVDRFEAGRRLNDPSWGSDSGEQYLVGRTVVSCCKNGSTFKDYSAVSTTTSAAPISP
ncbi:hypothetical protein D3C74_359060 [compost metagenome]